MDEEVEEKIEQTQEDEPLPEKKRVIVFSPFYHGFLDEAPDDVIKKLNERKIKS